MKDGDFGRQSCSAFAGKDRLTIQRDGKVDCEVFGPLIEAGLSEPGLGKVGVECDALGPVSVGEAIQFGDVAVGDGALDGEEEFDADLRCRLRKQW